METSNENIIVTEEKIIEKLNSIYGLDSTGKEEMMNYFNYIKLKKDKKIKDGNCNLFIQSKGNSDITDLMDVIKTVFLQEGLIKGDYDVLTELSYETFKYIEKTRIKLIVLDLRKEFWIWDLDGDIDRITKKNEDKYFIFILPKEERFKKEYFDNVAWHIVINEASKEDKIDFINESLKKNGIVIDKDFDLCNRLARDNMDNVKKEVLNLIVKCKSKHVKKLTESVYNNKIDKNLFEEKMDKIEDDEMENAEEKREKVKPRKKKEAMKKLDELIGIEEVKSQIKQIVNYIKVNKSRDHMPSLHMCFLGNPGTGKTTVARIVGELFAEENILSNKNIFIEAQRADLIGQYVGHTAPKTRDMVERANGGVLFIDEAYNLAPHGSKVDYGYECIATLIKEMEDRRENLCVILAGYTKEMMELLEVNPGFESRIQFKVNFPDYSVDELLNIFDKLVKDEKFKAESKVKEALIPFFTEEKKRENFSNARCARALFEKVKFEQADRVIMEKEKDFSLIKKVDVEKAVEKMRPVRVEERRIGF